MPDLDTAKFTTESITVTSTTADASADVLYTVPDNHSALIKFLHLSNGTASTKKAYIQFFHNDSSTYKYLANGLSMAGNSVSGLISSGEFLLHQKDKIVCYIESGMTLDVTVSAKEYFDPLRQ
ncbi:MAG: hypothetical protein VW496_00400 [Pelagibacteraceae bacterium]